MYKIVKKKSLNPTVTLMEIDAPLIAKRQSPDSSSFSVLTRTVSVFRLRLQAMTERPAQFVLSSRLSVQQQKSSITLTKAIIFTILQALSVFPHIQTVLKRFALQAAALAVQLHFLLPKSSTKSAVRFTQLSVSETRILLFLKMNSRLAQTSLFL